MAESDFQAGPPREPRRPAVRAQGGPPRVVYEGPDAVETFIPYKNPRGLLAYYLGLFSLVPCLGLLLGPAGLILGIVGLNYSKANPEARGAGHAIAGIVLGAIGTLGNYLVLILFLLGMAWSSR